jgi:hypothetical protein
VVTLAKVRQLALALPEATEQDHHGMNSFRVRNKIFATVPDGHHIRVMVDEPEILASVAECPSSCEPLYWGKRLACVVVTCARCGSTCSESCSPRPGCASPPRAWLARSWTRVDPSGYALASAPTT